MLYTTRSKLISSFLGVALLVGLITIYTGRQLLYKTVLGETESRISLDLNAARRDYQGNIDTISTVLNIAAFDREFQGSVLRKETEKLAWKLRYIAQQTGLDFAGIASADGVVISRVGPVGPSAPVKPSVPMNPLVQYVIRHGSSIAGTVVLDRPFLMSENPALAEQARIELIPTPMAAAREGKEETSGMVIGAGSPLFDGNRLIGVLYGGQLLNGSKELVDTVHDTVFQNEIYKGRSVGVATIFLGDTRISSNVLTPDGKRAIGTRASKKVRDSVLVSGQRWTDRAFVVSDWYLTAYEPITDIFNNRVGMLATGVSETKYGDVQRKVLTIFVLITIAGMLVAIGMGSFLANKIMKPIRSLISASHEVSNGNFAPEIGPQSKDEIGVLQKTFAEMLSFLQKRDKDQRVQSEIRLLQSEKQASVGRLAAGVAHEINNPLTGVLTFTHMLLRRKDLDDEMKADLTTIVKATERVRTIVKGLLDFSRQTVLAPEPTDINELVRSAVELVENNALVKGVKLSFKPMEGLPVRRVDRSAMQGVLLNIIMNALDATRASGSILVTTNLGYFAKTAEEKTIEISVTDTGQGIPPENLDRIFDPFFTTKDVGQGTGLGLSVSSGIVERHGGSIHVQSAVGKGSTFTIRLPLGDESEE
ncbi:MAG: ATP-binding protein [Syntrophorhabdales bacterium]